MTADIIEANIAVHTRMAASYNSMEPHFRDENQARVRQRLVDLRRQAPGGRLLDMGCGTGFIIHLCVDLFDEIHGIDVTQAMLDLVDTSSGRVHLYRSAAEHLPFDDNTFDVVTAYSFIHHTADYRAVAQEAFRVLSPGGMLYIDLEPNRRFWSAIEGVSKLPSPELSQIVEREVNAVLHTDSRIEREFGIAPEIFRAAEFTKSVLGGIDPDQLRSDLTDAGYCDVTVTPDWFLGQAAVMHGMSVEVSDHIDRYLRLLGPLGLHLFKYLRCTARKASV